MDVPSLATTAVQMVFGIVTGAIDRLGNRALQEAAYRAYDLIRQRLENSDLGRLALNQFDDQPAEQVQQEILRSVLAEAITSDPDFAQQLQDTATAYIAAQGSRSSVGGNQDNVNVTTVSGIKGRNQISIGPMTITNNRQTRISLLATAGVLLLLIISGTYGAVTFITGDNDSTALRPEPTENGPGSELENGSIGKTTQETVGLEYNDPYDGTHYESQFDATVQFAGSSSDYAGCGFSPPAGTIIVPVTVTLLNRNTGEPDHYAQPIAKIKSLNGIPVYYIYDFDILGVTCEPQREGENFLHGEWPGPQQQKEYKFAIVGVPEGNLSATWVVIDFTMVAAPFTTLKQVRATIS